MGNTKIKTLKRNMDDTETQISQLQSKLRKIQAELAEAEERAELAESSLSRAAGRNRPATAGRTMGRSEYVPRNVRNKTDQEDEE